MSFANNPKRFHHTTRKDVMAGYGMMMSEVCEHAAMKQHPPTHVFVQGGVGGTVRVFSAEVYTR
jgi:threonine dehydratase